MGMMGESVRVMSLPLKVVTSEELTSYAEQRPSTGLHVIEMMLFLGWNEGRAVGPAVMLDVSSLHGEP